MFGKSQNQFSFQDGMMYFLKGCLLVFFLFVTLLFLENNISTDNTSIIFLRCGNNVSMNCGP